MKRILIDKHLSYNNLYMMPGSLEGSVSPAPCMEHYHSKMLFQY
jgi:hypothetical protein